MERKLKTAKVEEAMRRAAESAVHGPPSARIGRLTQEADVVLTRRDRLRRAVLLCCAFMRNLAYYRAAYEHPVGWKDEPLVDAANFWRTTNGNFLDGCVLEWCKLFADASGQHGWESLVSDKTKFENALFKHLGLESIEFEEFRQGVRLYRDKFIAHLDSDLTMIIPMLDHAKASIEFYHEHLAEKEAVSSDLFGLPNTAEKLRSGYEQCMVEAAAVYRAAGLRKGADAPPIRPG